MVTDIKDSGVTAQTMLEIGNEVNIIFNGVKLPTCPTEGNKQYGIRLGTNVISSRNYTPGDCWEVARFVNEIFLKRENVLATLRISLTVC